MAAEPGPAAGLQTDSLQIIHVYVNVTNDSAVLGIFQILTLFLIHHQREQQPCESSRCGGNPPVSAPARTASSTHRQRAYSAEPHTAARL
jgi:hypothetical protein